MLSQIQQGAESEVKLLGLELVFIQDASTVGGSLTNYITVLVLCLTLLKASRIPFEFSKTNRHGSGSLQNCVRVGE